VFLGTHLLIGAHTEKSMVLERGEDNNREQDLDHQYEFPTRIISVITTIKQTETLHIKARSYQGRSFSRA
jgi:hypothetical protein